jgi:hypothetical protein
MPVPKELQMRQKFQLGKESVGYGTAGPMVVRKEGP